MKPNYIVSFILLFAMVSLIIFQTDLIDWTDYRDYEMSAKELTTMNSVFLKSSQKPYCVGKDGIEPGFYDIKALGGMKNNEEFTKYNGGILEKNQILENIYISDTECIYVDGNVEIIPSLANYQKYNSENFTISQTTDLIVGKNIESGIYKVEADIPKDCSIQVSSNNENKIANSTQELAMLNTSDAEFNEIYYHDIIFKAKNNDVISFNLGKINAEEVYYDDFRVKIKKINS